MENHLYACMYETLNSDDTHEGKLQKLNRYKAKIVRLHAQRTEQIMLDQSTYDKIQDEQPSLFHLLKQNQRREARTISSIQDIQGHEIKSATDICNLFETYLKKI
jgi:hypothetical protein